MRKIIILALLLSSLVSLSPFALIGRACRRVGPISLDDILLKADAVVRASAIEYVKAPLERVVNFSALFAAICFRLLPSSIVISLIYGTKGLSD